jgi:5-formyltetrahydrofolate cyclo-ligase
MDMLQLYSLQDLSTLPSYSLDDLSTLPPTKWNIKQPAGLIILRVISTQLTDLIKIIVDYDNSRANALDCGGLDMILIPGLGFTPEGDRLGRGKGYYDRYLAKCEAKGCIPKTIGCVFICLLLQPSSPCFTTALGLAFSVQVCKTIPMGPSDKRLDLVLYSEGTVPNTIEI